MMMGGLVFEAGIKRWGGRGFGVRRMGYSEIDAASSEEDGDGEGKSYYAGDDYGIPRNSTPVASNMMGRRSFGKFNRELEVSFILSPSVSLPSCFFKRCLSMIWFRVDVFFFPLSFLLRNRLSKFAYRFFEATYKSLLYSRNALKQEPTTSHLRQATKQWNCRMKSAMKNQTKKEILTTAMTR